MSRLPTPNGDDGQWGAILNDYLGVEHAADGTLKIRTDGTLKTTLASLTDVTTSGATNAQVLGYSSSTSTWSPMTVGSGGTTPDASSGTKGIVQLTGDLSGVATAPVVAKVNGVAVSGTPSAGQALVASSGTAASWSAVTATDSTKLAISNNLSELTSSAATVRTNLGLGSAATQASSAFDAAGAASSAQTAAASDATTKANAAQAAAIAASAQKSNNLSDLASASTARTNLGLGTAATISATAGGDLTGTLPTPTVAKINGVTLPGSAPTAGQVLTATNGTTTSWSTPAAGAGNATTSAVGVVQLSGDLAGSATAPTVPSASGLRSATTSIAVSAATAPTAGQVLTATSGTAAAWSTPAAGAGNATTSAVGVVQLSGDLAGSATAPTVPNASGLRSATTSVSVASATAPTAGQVLTASSSTAAAWTTPTTASNATTGATGLVQLAGDLGGSATAPTVPSASGLRSATTSVSVSAATAPTAGQVLTATSGTAAAWSNPTVGAQALAAAAVKTSAYSAASGDLIPVDASSAAVTITLPSAPADKTRIAVKKIDSSVNTVTIAAAGSDVFNKTGGNTSITLSTANQMFTLQYSSSAGIWYAADAPSQAVLDLRYILGAQAGVAGGVATLDSSGLVPTSQLPLSTQAITLTGSGAPSSSLGQNGDAYIDYSTGNVYIKSSGSWGSSVATLGSGGGGGGGASVNVVTKTSAYTAANGDVVFATGTFTVTAPTATSGSMVTIKNNGTGTVTFAPAGSSTVDGATTFALTNQYDSFRFISDGTNWGVF